MEVRGLLTGANPMGIKDNKRLLRGGNYLWKHICGSSTVLFSPTSCIQQEAWDMKMESISRDRVGTNKHRDRQ